MLRLSRSPWTLAVFAAALLATGPSDRAGASHTFSTSVGVYRIPYEDGLDVTISGDHHDHNPVDRIDMFVADGEPVVAAATGIIRAIVDNHGDDAEEHSCQDDDTVVGDCSDYNNYVWIEHPNGEWTKYTHFQTGTVTGRDWVVGDPIEVGEELGLEGDVGRAGGPHLHFEVGLPDDPDDLTPFCVAGGFMVGTNCDFGVNLVPRICDIPDNLFVTGETYEAAPCDHDPPTADAGGDYVVDEGSTVVLDGSGSSDPEDNVLTYLWAPDDRLDDASLAMPTYSGLDDVVDDLTLTVYDQIEALHDSDTTTVTVNNVPPTVTVTGDSINEGETATVSATFTDPGTEDTHTATIDWGDGGAVVPVTVAALALGVDHVYGDNGTYPVTVTVTDDDGGEGSDSDDVVVANLDPVPLIDTSGAISFPGGDYLVVEAGTELPATADGSDEGSDDLTFGWSVGDVNIYFNDGLAPDPLPSPFGDFPFMASDSIDALYAAPGAESLVLTLTDDDGGSEQASAGVIVTGTADSTQGSGWWKHQYSGNGAPHVDAATAAGYLEIVNAVSSVFSEDTPVATLADVHAVLSPTGGAKRPRAIAELMVAWLQFASGAVAYDATVPTGGGTDYLDLMFAAEETILDPTSTNAELHAIGKSLAKVRHAS